MSESVIVTPDGKDGAVSRRPLRFVAIAAVAVVITSGLASAAPADPLTPVTAPVLTPGALSVSVTWNASDYDAASATDPSYRVQLLRPDFTALGSPKIVAAGQPTEAIFRQLDPSLAYHVRVSKYDGVTEVARSDALAAATPLRPTTPVGLKATPGVTRGTIVLTWARSAELPHYRILRDNVALADVWSCATTTCRYVDNRIRIGTRYEYRIVATMGYTRPTVGTAESSPSAGAAALPSSRPWAPTGVTAKAGDHTIALRWIAPTGVKTGGWPILRYSVTTYDETTIPWCETRPNAMCLAPAQPTAVTRVVRNVPADKAFRFKIKSVTKVGPSSSVSSPSAQAFTADPPFSRGMRGPTITELQNRLNWAGLETPVTGVFDKQTQRQVEHLQGKFLYDQDGEVGPTLWKLLKRITKTNGVLPSQCQDTAICVSKAQKVLRYVVDGVVVRTMDARFGPEGGGLATGEGLFDIQRKDGCSSGADPNDYGSLLANCHVSTTYKTPMPWSMFFNGGQAVHYSWYFARDGYWGNSHGCVNVADWEGVYYIYHHADYGTPVYVYW